MYTQKVNWDAADGRPFHLVFEEGEAEDHSAGSFRSQFEICPSDRNVQVRSSRRAKYSCRRLIGMLCAANRAVQAGDQALPRG